MSSQELVIYKAPTGDVKVDATLTDGDLWMSQSQIVELFQTSKSNISEHIKHIFDDGELDINSVVRNFRTTATDGKSYNTKFYNLDVILAVGYRINSTQAIMFRKWATSILHEYLQKGFVMNDELLKNMGGGIYWNELLSRIRDIRSSEKVFYKQVLDLYATSIDYDPKSEQSIQFFKVVQNKIHFGAHGHTAAEVIFERADAKQNFMGLKTFKGMTPKKDEITIAKNYLSEQEMDILNRMSSTFFDNAELYAKMHKPMYMRDWIKELDEFCEKFGKGALDSAGKISHKEAIDKANIEYEKYAQRILSEPTEVETAYINSIKELQKIEGGVKDNE